MMHVLALLTDLLTDSQFVHALTQNLFFLGVANSSLILFLGVFRVVRHRKLSRSVPSHVHVRFSILRRHSS